MIQDFNKFKTFESTDNASKYDKYLKLAIDDILEMRRFPLQYFPALVGTVKNKAGEAKLEEIPSELVDACKDAIIDVYFSNIEPEWETEEQWNFWEKLSKDSLVLKHANPNSMWNGSPYKDKTIPYIEWNPDVRKTVPSINFA